MTFNTPLDLTQKEKFFSPFCFFDLKTRSQVRHVCKIQTLCMEMWTFLYSFYVTIRIRLIGLLLGNGHPNFILFLNVIDFWFSCALLNCVCLTFLEFVFPKSNTLLSELPDVAQVIHSYSRRKSIYEFGLSVSLFVCVQ